MPAKKRRKKPKPFPKPKRTEEARQAAREYADDRRAILDKLRRKMN